MIPLRAACLAAAVCTAVSVATVHSATCPAPKFDIRGEYYFFPLPPEENARIATGDWNEDGKPDLAVTNFSGNLVVMFGQGSFQMCEQPALSLGHGGPIVATDLDRDGHRDLVVSGLHRTTLLRGDGAGGFTIEETLDVDGGWDLAVGRLDADLDPDLVLGGFDRIRLIRLNGFAFADSDSIAFQGFAFDLADVDGDSDLDLVAAGYDEVENIAGIWLNDGAGNLALSSSNLTENVSASSIAIGDLNGDEFLDIMGVSSSPDWSAFWLYGNGDGTFDATPVAHRGGTAARKTDPPLTPLHIPPSPHFILLADLNHDDVTERVTLCNERGLEVMNRRSVDNPTDAVVADFNADGLLDVAAVSREGVAIHPSLLDGTLRTTRVASFGMDPWFSKLVDLDGSPMLDMLVATDGEIIQFEGTGGGGFTRLPQNLPSGGLPYLLADVDGDGDEDLFSRDGLNLSNGDGSFDTNLTPYLPSSSPAVIAGGKIDSDAHLDLIATLDDPPNRIYVLRGDGAGNFTPIDSVDAEVRSLDLVDLDADGELDMIGRGPSEGFVRFGVGTGAFSAPVQLGAELQEPFVFGDLDGNGDVDVITATTSSKIGKVFLNQDRVFTEIAGGFIGTPVAVGDIGDDGTADLITTHYAVWLVPYRGGGDGTFDIQPAIGPGGAVFLDDRNDDGKPDLVVVRDDDVDDYLSTISVITNLTPRDPTAVLGIQATAETGAGWVRLSWYAPDRMLARADVMRRVEGGAWSKIGEAMFDGSGHATFTDRSVVPGRYAYRLVAWLGGRGVETDELWAVVSGGGLELAGLRPHPSTGPLNVAFTLPRPGDVRLEMIDITGRRVVERRWTAMPAGAHVERIGARLAPGVYTMRLASAGETRSVRAVVIR